jgi:cobaltochelatase CobN
MSGRQLTFLFVDATSTHLPVLARAVAALTPEESAAIKVIARSKDDLFDKKRIEAAVDLAGRVDGVVLLPHGGAESIPGAAALAAAARGAGTIAHIQAGPMSAEEVDFAKAHASDFGSVAYKARYAYIRRGGVENLRSLLVTLARERGGDLPEPPAPKPQPTEGIYHPGWSGDLSDRDAYLSWQRERLNLSDDAPVVGIWFYQSFWLNGDLALFDFLISEVEARGAIPLAVFHQRFRDADLGNMSVEALVAHFFKKNGKPLIEVLLSPMSFSLGMTGQKAEDILGGLDVPVLQLILTMNPRAEWEEPSRR